MNDTQNSSFFDLLRAWNDREAIRSTGDFRTLVDANIRLSEQRATTQATLAIR